MPGDTLKRPQHLIYSLQVIWSFAAAEACLYGVYLVLVAFYLHVLRTRGLRKQRFLMVATMALFILSTIHCALVLATAILGTRKYIDDHINSKESYVPSWRGLSLASSGIYVTANVIADSIFIFRCYAIWDSRLSIVLLPIFLTLGVAGVGYFDAFAHFADRTVFREVRMQVFLTISIAVSLVTTLVLMALTVGRIWWFAREARQVMGENIVRKYHTVCAMILESGALYFIGGVVFILPSFPIAIESTMNGTVLGQLVGIAPTIIAVRVGLGYSVDSVDSFIVPRPQKRSPSQLEATTSPMDGVEDVILYIRPESVKHAA
ncbi:hypothetical protein MVEN_01689900 [Mycena venus]|uniref:Uncharacterized protein n=1 Tax=Mycena venus TaxID=2733690 RepID=A0A8H7CN87_9AGAR|nr:hypothetical protein MVEN_01689900 [Mycena venus]